MITYKTPTIATFYNRKQFHATQKTQSESISDWFNRLQNFIAECRFENVSDYMLIDKFVSGLSESDFEKIAPVAKWTVDELVLVVIGNTHIFKSNSCKEYQEIDVNETAYIQIKCEDIIDAENESNENFHDKPNEEDLFEVIKTDDMSSCETHDETIILPVGKRSPRDIRLRNKKHLDKLKETGRYEDYKKKKAECAKKRRLQAKNNEQYLPPEIQLHIMNERRRATRERVKRCRERKSQMMTETVQSAVTATEPLKIESKVKTVKGQKLTRKQKSTKKTTNKSTKIKTKSKSTPKVIPNSIAKSYYVRKRQFECYMCLLKCKKLYELKTHLNIFHPVEKKESLNCPHCPKTTISREVLSRHLRKYHADVQMHKCPCCEKEYNKRSELRDHLALHPDYRPFICETCGNGFKSMQELTSHFRKHTGEKRFKCGVCDMLLVSSSSYKGHMLTHTGERPYPCKLCDKEFRQISSLRKHLISIHNQGEKPHLCTTCNKRFASIYHLRIHSNSHTGDRPYRCQFCNSTFSQPSALKAHTGRIHENELRLQNT